MVSPSCLNADDDEKGAAPHIAPLQTSVLTLCDDAKSYEADLLHLTFLRHGYPLKSEDKYPLGECYRPPYLTSPLVSSMPASGSRRPRGASTDISWSF